MSTVGKSAMQGNLAAECALHKRTNKPDALHNSSFKQDQPTLEVVINIQRRQLGQSGDYANIRYEYK